MNILYSIGVIAIGIFSVIVLPIIVVVFFVGVAGLIARLGICKAWMAPPHGTRRKPTICRATRRNGIECRFLWARINSADFLAI